MKQSLNHQDQTGDDADQALVIHAQRDPAAFAPLYRRYVDLVFRYCLHRLGTRELAEDATAQTFIRALAAIPTHHPDRSFRSWLFAIAHNVVTDHYRAGRPVDSLTIIDDLPDRNPSTEDVAIAATEASEVRALLHQLPPDQRRILELRLAGLTGVEVADILGRSPGAIKIAQVRAYARLRDLLGIARPPAVTTAETSTEQNHVPARRHYR